MPVCVCVWNFNGIFDGKSIIEQYNNGHLLMGMDVIDGFKSNCSINGRQSTIRLWTQWVRVNEKANQQKQLNGQSKGEKERENGQNEQVFACLPTLDEGMKGILYNRCLELLLLWCVYVWCTSWEMGTYLNIWPRHHER